jgi:hypothetical protein
MPITTTDNDIKERLSVAYVAAVAARVGCEVREFHVQRNGLDATISAIAGIKAKIDVQLKATSTDCVKANHIAFDLDVATYDELRSAHVQSPQLLVILVLPEDAAEWLALDEESLVLKRCAYWHNLQGQPAVSNRGTIRVYLPRSNIFAPEALRSLMERADAHARMGQTGI